MPRALQAHTGVRKSGSPLAGSSPVSAVERVAPVDKVTFDHEHVTAAVVVGQHHEQWVAEFRFRFKCGRY